MSNLLLLSVILLVIYVDDECWDAIEKMSHMVTLVMIITEVNEGINLTASSKAIVLHAPPSLLLRALRI